MMPAGVWWPLAALTRALGRPVRGPGDLLDATADQRVCGARLLAGMPAADPLWDEYAADTATPVLSTLASLPGLPDRVAVRLAERQPMLPSLFGNPGIDPDALDRLLPRANSDCLVALAANPAWRTATRLRIPARDSAGQVRDALALAYSHEFGLLTHDERNSSRLLRAFLSNPATPPDDVLFVFDRASVFELIEFADDIANSPAVPPELLHNVAEALLRLPHRAQARSLVAVAHNPNVSTKTLRRMAEVPSYDAMIAASPKLPADLVASYLERVASSPHSNVVGVLRNPQVPRSEALTHLRRPFDPVILAALANPNVTPDDIAAAAASADSPDDQLAVLATKALRQMPWWPTVTSFPDLASLRAGAFAPPVGAPPIPAGAFGALLTLIFELDLQDAVAAARCL